MSARVNLPRIIQGGMGIGVSDFRLARAVALAGGLGVVSGTAIDTVMTRRLELGDEDGLVREALAAFPFRATARRIKDRYFVPGGIDERQPFQLLSLPQERMKHLREATFVVAAFVEVYLAKRGHTGPIGMNLLEKIQLPTLPTLFGAMLAGVDVVLVGAGIPQAIPGVLDAFSRLEPAELKLHVEGSKDQTFSTRFSPSGFIENCRKDEEGELTPEAQALCGDAEAHCGDTPSLPRPAFLAIISSHILAKQLHKKASGRVDGFVVEGHVAGGHNAPPRKKAQEGEPLYGEADAPNLQVLRDIGLPFWLAGGYVSTEHLADALREGARGIQVGTVFAYAKESGITADIKRRVFKSLRRKSLHVVTDLEASPTGYPFKLVLDHADPSEIERLRHRERVCDLGYLRQAYVDEAGRVGYRCPGEPEGTFVKKGGALEETKNKICLCNGLLATVGLGQRRPTGDELPILTSGENLEAVLGFLGEARESYSAADVVLGLLGRRGASAAE